MSLEGFQRQLIFATPVIVGRIPGATDLNPALERVILDRRKADPGIERSNIGGWHSRPDILNWGGDALHRVVRQVVELANANVGEIPSPPDWAVEAWANVSERGGANHQHIHPGCFWSAVYYVRTDPGEGGELILHDPRMPVLNMHAPHLRFRDAGPEQVVQTIPSAGMLVLFPSWLSHSVRPWLGDGMRISIAINLSAPPALKRPG